MDKVELSKALGIEVDERGALQKLLKDLEVSGEVVRIRKDRYVIPQDADLVVGTMQFHASGSAHLLCEKPGEKDLFIAPENSWTAMHGDKVVARVQELHENSSISRRPAPRREGRVIRILERANETIVGTLQKSKNFFYVVADDPRFVHNLYVPAPTAELPARIGEKVVAHLDSWPSRHVNPEGHLVEVLGPASRPDVGVLAIIKKNRLPLEFPDGVVEEARRQAKPISVEEIAQREDRRDKFILTIDPDDARDFDDAIEVERTESGWSVGVHIADVSHYVRPKTALDREAESRGNSVYLADRVIPMLPVELSNGICSLRPNEDRLTFSAFAEITRQGKFKAVRFAKTVIRSKVRLTYKEAFARLQKPADDEISRHLHVAWELSSFLRKRRYAAGSLDLDFPEAKVWLDEEGRAVRIEKIENDISHQLIEELMLLANELVARELKISKQPTVYRVHEKPDPDKLAELRETVLVQGIRVGDLTKREEIQKLISLSKGRPNELSIKLSLLKSLKRARYAPEPLGHYGLHKSDYTHFTSPIRRYADLVVHRAMERRLGLTKSGPSSSQLDAICEHISTTERIAAEAEKESVKLKKLEYFQAQLANKSGETFRAKIMEVRNYGLLIDLPDFLMTGLIHVSALDGDFYILDTVRSRLAGKRSKKVYEVGDELEVIVARVDIFKQQVDFRPTNDVSGLQREGDKIVSRGPRRRRR